MKINIKEIMYLLLAIPFLKPDIIGNFQAVNNIFYCMKIISFFIIIGLLVFKRKKLTGITKSIMLFYLILLFTTLINKANISALISEIINTLGFCLLFEFGINDNPKYLTHSIRNILDIEIIINLITIILYPNGMYTNTFESNWFLGYRNPQIRILIPAIAISLIDDFLRINRISKRSIIMIFLVGLTVLSLKSSTGFVGFITLITFFILLLKNIINVKMVNLNKVMLIIFSLFLLIVVYQNSQIFSFVIEKILHRDVTLTGRYRIWPIAIDVAMKNWFLGIGYYNGNDFSKIFINVGGAVHPHNYILYIILQGGIIALIQIVLLNIKVNKELVKNYDSVFSKTLLACLIAFFVMSISESLTQAILLYPLYILAGNISLLVKNQLNNNGKKESEENK